mmetsp:Transcript_110386/g.252699  ORF Transcript_110386/g.252699 Transcript_110386/m.252699 type:complete len:408 (+) Transcript_110386:912-2135(+)
MTPPGPGSSSSTAAAMSSTAWSSSCQAWRTRSGRRCWAASASRARQSRVVAWMHPAGLAPMGPASATRARIWRAPRHWEGGGGGVDHWGALASQGEPRQPPSPAASSTKAKDSASSLSRCRSNTASRAYRSCPCSPPPTSGRRSRLGTCTNPVICSTPPSTQSSTAFRSARLWAGRWRARNARSGSRAEATALRTSAGRIAQNRRIPFSTHFLVNASLASLTSSLHTAGIDTSPLGDGENGGSGMVLSLTVITSSSSCFLLPTMAPSRSYTARQARSARRCAVQGGWSTAPRPSESSPRAWRPCLNLLEASHPARTPTAPRVAIRIVRGATPEPCTSRTRDRILVPGAGRRGGPAIDKLFSWHPVLNPISNGASPVIISMDICGSRSAPAADALLSTPSPVTRSVCS